MALTKAQSNDIDILLYFAGKSREDITDDDIKEYLDWSERGIGNGGILSVMKQRRGILMGEYEKGILEGLTPYMTILGFEEGDTPMPEYVVEFIKKELFKGRDSDLIDKIYRDKII